MHYTGLHVCIQSCIVYKMHACTVQYIVHHTSNYNYITMLMSLAQMY